MADKPTKRERKDEAKRRRLEEMRRRQRRARMRKIYTMATVAAVLVAIVAVVLVSRASNQRAREAAAKLAASAGCEPPKEYPSEGQEHITPPAKASYKTDPPTSGSHYATPGDQKTGLPPAPGPTGVLAQALPDENHVHNLEHGHVLIHYQQGAINEAQLESLKALVQKDPTWVMLAPRQNRDTKIAFTAWQVLQKCNEPNDNIDKVAADFIKRFKDKGPESAAGSPIFQTPPPAPAATGSPKATTTPKASGSPKATTTPKATATPSS